VKVCNEDLTSLGRVVLTPTAEAVEVSESKVVVFRAEAAQLNLAFVQVVFLPVVAQ